MAVAFTREEDLEAAAAHLPDRPVSPHRNYVTRAGLGQIEAEVTAAQAAFATAQAAGDLKQDRSAMAQAVRDLRYWRARRASAEVVDPVPGARVQFGSTVTVLREDGRRQTFRIVGEDEADAARGSVSHVSPITRALFGKGVGDEAVVAGAALEVVDVA